MFARPVSARARVAVKGRRTIARSPMIGHCWDPMPGPWLGLSVGNT